MAEKNRKERNDDSLVTRREMLRRLGNYSAIAAALLAAPSALLLKGCGGGGGGGGVGPTGDTADTAIPIGLGGSVSDISLDADSNGVIYYKLDAQDGPVQGVIDVTSLTADYSDAVVCTVLDSALEVVETPISVDVAVPILLTLDPDVYYIVFECASGTATFSFELLDTSQPHSDWDDAYSEWTDAYSDWDNSVWDNTPDPIWADSYPDAYQDGSPGGWINNYGESPGWMHTPIPVWQDYTPVWQDYTPVWQDFWNNFFP